MEYISSFIPEAVRRIPTHMDFDGQRRAEKYFQIIIVVFAVVGFVWGYITQLFSQTLYILFAGVAVSAVLTLIPWGMYRKQPLNWQPARDKDGNLIQNTRTQPAPIQYQIKLKKKKLKD